MDFEDAATDLKTVDEQGLSLVSKLANVQLTLEQRVTQLEDELKQAKRSLREIAEEQLPSAMAEHSISELVLEDGSRVSVGKFYSASISKDKSDEALDHMMQVAAEAEHPRAFEVLAGMFKTSADMTTQLIDLQKKRHELDKLNNEPTQSGVTNNNLFVGSTAELQKMLSKRADNDN